MEVENECIPEMLLKATNIFNEISKDVGDFSNRKWKTKIPNVPTDDAVDIINTVCNKLIALNVNECVFPRNFWLINCIVYSAVVAYLLNNDFKNVEIKKKSSGTNNNEPAWVLKIRKEIKETRGFISKCEAERLRLTRNGRLTRKSRRNRKQMEKCLREGETIGCVSLTVLVEKQKNKLKRLSKSLKRKIKNNEASKLNRQFKTNQKTVFNDFKQIIEEWDGEGLPVYKKPERKERQVFQNAQEVVDFWAGIWEKNDTGNANAAWVNEIEEVFREIIPEVDCGRMPIVYELVLKSIKKKKNWSGPGPDLIVNFWWKKLTSTHPWITIIFDHIINENVFPGVWFPIGRVALIPKDGEWSVPNQRPITCTNNIYKWYTSVLRILSKNHLDRYNLMQIDQRGAKSECSGTSDNLLLDDTIIRDAIIHHRNLSVAWLDVRKAFDSLSHSYLKKMITIHRFPEKLTKALWTIMENWFVRIDIPTTDGTIQSRIIVFSNGELQGDSLGPDLYTLSKNPISWIIRMRDGYIMSSPIKEKVTHSLFVDDLKKYDRGTLQLKYNLQEIRIMMFDAGLGWNEKKCKCAHLKNGKIFIEDVTLDDGFKLKCLEDTDSYKFLGVPECIEHDTPNLTNKLVENIESRANVIWSSPLSDFNKVISTNTFVNSTAEYFFWSEKFRLEDLRKMDICVRKAIVKHGAKHYQQLNSLLYLPKTLGGRGLRCFERTYKETKIKAAVKLLETKDERIKLVRKFNLVCMKSKHSSIFKDAISYAGEMNLTLRIDECSYDMTFESNEGPITTDSIEVIKGQLKKRRNEQLEFEVLDTTWQGLNFKYRKEDPHLHQGCYDWLKGWQNVPSYIVRDIYDLYCQTLNTKTFQLIRSETPPSDTSCRLCKNGNESVMHILNRCEKLRTRPYTKRHDEGFLCFFNELLLKLGFISNCPPWFSQSKPKPFYNNEVANIWWDIPEFSGAADDNDGERLLRPDGKVMLKAEKKIFLLEITISWIDNRGARYKEKVDKYAAIRRNLERDEPDYIVDQITLVMDSLGGYSQDLRDNIGKVLGERKVVDRVIRKMQKSVLNNSVHVSRCFKLEAGI